VGIPTRVIRDYYENPGYIDSLVAQIERTLQRFEAAGAIHLVFSAHNVPQVVIEAGDPYCQQIESTMRRVIRRGGWAAPAHLCYQSKVGGARWLEPSLDRTIRDLVARGAEDLLVVPISFVSDHVETLSEIDIEAREKAERCGIRQFEMMPGLNDSPSFIGALAGMVREALGPQKATTGQEACPTAVVHIGS